MILLSEWRVTSFEEQKAATDATMSDWALLNWPIGLLSYNSYLGTDNTTIVHYSQWTSQEAMNEFIRVGFPDQVRRISARIPSIVSHGIATYHLQRSVTSVVTDKQPGCIVFVRASFSKVGLAPAWIDAIVNAVSTDPNVPQGGISGHFHLSEDGLNMVNYAEWISEQAHIAALNEGRIAQTSTPQWQHAHQLMSTVNDLSVIRSHFYKSWSI